MKTSVLLTILTSASASLCCIVPILGVIGGSGSLLSSISWLEPLRPYFITATVGILGFAWLKALNPVTKDGCGCEPEKWSFLQSKGFLGVVTVLSLLLLTFPSYCGIFQNYNSAAASHDQEKDKKITLGVIGMTCASCEHHIESEVLKLSGISSIKASYASNSTTVEYNPDKVSEEKIVAAINATGYTVNKNVNLLQEKPKANCCTKGSCTPETCSNKNTNTISRE
jgi:copper chaperone CopZ